ncbi:MAG: pyridoxal phosphate-dependent aminotransferase [Firmicutes bacterium]|nr:pyridoxal phosphate-dependent aminotransferase [Bacillota bacterium]
MNDFDKIIDRRGTCCAKYDFAAYGKPDDIVSLWVADMDFKAPDPVTARIREIADHGIFGYGSAGDSYYEALNGWFSRNFNFPIEKKHVISTPGVVFAIASAIKAFTAPGDAVMINQPVYYPFINLIKQNKRNLINSPLIRKNDSYYIDFNDFEQKIIKNNVKLYILCSPHNPVGRVWTRDELTRIAEICLKHNVIIVSDEIHCDFVWSSHPHTILSSISRECADISIICTAPSKTFNLAGLQASNIIIQNEILRKKFRREVFSSGFSELNIIGAAACEAAYRYGELWLAELRAYINDNINFMYDFVNSEIPGISLNKPEGTYLTWLDCRNLGLGDEELDRFITDKAKLWTDGGIMFGNEGSGFQRINAACPKSLLQRAMEQLKQAVKEIDI